MNRKINIATAVVFALFFASYAGAAINPKFLKQDQIRAPEKLILKVLKVTVDKRGNAWHVLATAQVKEVKTSRSGLKAGAKIVIRYTSQRPSEKRGWTGPKPTPVLSQGLVGAYLWGPDKRGAYAPAARSMSFVSPKHLRNTPTPKRTLNTPTR